MQRSLSKRDSHRRFSLYPTRIHLGLWLLIAMLGATGCAPTRPVIEPRPELPESFPYHTAAQILQAIEATTSGVESFESRASVRVDAPDQKASFTALIRQRGSDSLFATFSPGLGLEAARALVTPDSFYVHDRLRNRLYYGGRESVAHYIPGEADLVSLRSNLLGLVRPDPRVQWTVDADTALYYLRSDTRLYVVDPSIWRIVRIERYGAGGELLEERVFSDFERIDRWMIARSISLVQPLDGQAIDVYHRSVSLNPSNLTFPFRIPSSARRVLIGETE